MALYDGFGSWFQTKPFNVIIVSLALEFSSLDTKGGTSTKFPCERNKHWGERIPSHWKLDKLVCAGIPDLNPFSGFLWNYSKIFWDFGGSNTHSPKRFSANFQRRKSFSNQRARDMAGECRLRSKNPSECCCLEADKLFGLIVTAWNPQHNHFQSWSPNWSVPVNPLRVRWVFEVDKHTLQPNHQKRESKKTYPRHSQTIYGTFTNITGSF